MNSSLRSARAFLFLFTSVFILFALRQPAAASVKSLRYGAAGPAGIVFDGQNIWIANNAENSLSMINPADGKTLKKFATASPGPNDLAFDGVNIWACAGDGTVQKFQASDGQLLGTFPAGPGPHNIFFDGTNIWVPNSPDHTITKLLAADGTLEATFDVPSGQPNGVTSDGTNLWLTNYYQVIKMDPSNGTVLATYGLFQNPEQILFDGSDIWFTETGGLQAKLVHNVYKMQPSDGTILSKTETNSRPYAIATDGNMIFVACNSRIAVDQVRIADGALMNIYPLQGHERYTLSFLHLAVENGNVWVTCNTSRYLFDFVDKIIPEP